MRRCVDIRFADHVANVAQLCRAPWTALQAVDRARILPGEFRSACRHFAWLRQAADVVDAGGVSLSIRRAEELLAACDAVAAAVDAEGIDGAELARALEHFATLRCLLYAACSGAPSADRSSREAA